MSSPLGTVQILLVEDSPSDAKLTIRALRKSGVANRIDHVTDGEEALDYIFKRGAFADTDEQQDPRVVFLDIKLPKVDGLEVLRQIRANPRTHALPVVLLTSSREERDVANGYALQANSYIVKPVDFQQFAETVKTLGLYWVVMNTPPVGVTSPAEAPAGAA